MSAIGHNTARLGPRRTGTETRRNGTTVVGSTAHVTMLGPMIRGARAKIWNFIVTTTDNDGSPTTMGVVVKRLRPVVNSVVVVRFFFWKFKLTPMGGSCDLTTTITSRGKKRSVQAVLLLTWLVITKPFLINFNFFLLIYRVLTPTEPGMTLWGEFDIRLVPLGPAGQEDFVTTTINSPLSYQQELLWTQLWTVECRTAVISVL